MDRTAPIRPGQGQTLHCRISRSSKTGGATSDNLAMEPSVRPEAAEQRQMQPIDVRVHDVEIFDPLRE